MTQNNFFQNLPDKSYWKDRLTCKGCNFPLTPPVFYCYNTSALHPLCKSCSQCNVSTCRAKVGIQRSIIIERILALVSFSCEFKCQKGPFEASAYKLHLPQCHLRPMLCMYCQNFIPFTQYLTHLQQAHDIRESPLDKETLIINFSESQPRNQIVKFGAAPFLVCFENGKLWVEYFGIEENSEVDYHIRVAGVKYDIDFQMEVVNARGGIEIIKSGGGQPGELTSSSTYNKFIVPPKDEELFLLFIQELDNDTISSIGEDLSAELEEAERMSFSV